MLQKINKEDTSQHFAKLQKFGKMICTNYKTRHGVLCWCTYVIHQYGGQNNIIWKLLWLYSLLII